MSREAISWALRHAPDVPPQCVSVLIGLADAADSQGHGAFLGQATLAGYARKSDRQVRSDLLRLGELGLIRRGDQSRAGHIAADARPVVWDLAMERKRTSGRKSASGRKYSSGRPDDTSLTSENARAGGSQLPGGSTVPAGSTASRERKPTSDEPTTNKDLQGPTDPAANGPRPTLTQRSKRITDAYAEAQPMCRWPAINGVVMHAIKSGKYADDEIREALLRMAKSGQGVTVESLRVELEGLAPRASPGRERERAAQRQRQMDRAKAREEAGS